MPTRTGPRVSPKSVSEYSTRGGTSGKASRRRRPSCSLRRRDDVVWTFGLDLGFRYTSPASRRITGYTAEEIRAIGLHDLLSPESFELDRVMADHIRLVLDLCKGRVEGEKGAAKRLNINPSTLRKRMKKMNIPFGRKKH